MISDMFLDIKTFDMAKFLYAVLTTIVASCITYVNFNYIISLYCKYMNQHEIEDPKFNWTSSVRCHMSNGSKLCNFKNVCYLPDRNQFLFTLTEHSFLLGLESKEELKSIYLSSVPNHNLLSMKIAVVSYEHQVLESATFIDQPLFLLWRFKWDNVMHVLHDDLIPLFLTYLDICGEIHDCVSKYRLGYLDQGEDGPYNELYLLFSNQQPLFLNKHNKPLCINEVHAGMLNASIWFQYGFGQKQGPLNTSVPIVILRQFRDYVVHRYGISEKDSGNKTVVFLNRRLNRKILNNEYFTSILIDTVQKTYPSSQTKINELDLATHNITTILDVLLTSKIVVGMHGSAMIFCLFLPPGSVVVELFPFGIQPEKVSFIKAFSNILGTGIVYRSWVNHNETLSVAHPEAPPLLGGIKHLPKAKQELIWDTKIVPAVECCHDPMYLFRMFQDTVVGPDFVPSLQEALIAQQMFSKEILKTTYINNLFSSWFFPAPVTNVSCTVHHYALTALWQPSINALDSVIYDIIILLDRSNLLSETTAFCRLNINLNYTVHIAEIWIKAISSGNESMDNYSQCLIT